MPIADSTSHIKPAGMKVRHPRAEISIIVSDN